MAARWSQQDSPQTSVTCWTSYVYRSSGDMLAEGTLTLWIGKNATLALPLTLPGKRGEPERNSAGMKKESKFKYSQIDEIRMMAWLLQRSYIMNTARSVRNLVSMILRLLYCFSWKMKKWTLILKFLCCGRFCNDDLPPVHAPRDLRYCEQLCHLLHELSAVSLSHIINHNLLKL